MSVVISSGFTLVDVQSGGGVIDENNPLIGYNNLIVAGNSSASSSASGYPALNVANPSTALEWRGADVSPAVDHYLTFALNTNELVDYLAIARHNFYSEQIFVSVEVFSDAVSPASWVEVISPLIPPNDGPLLFRFTPQGITSIRVRMQPGAAAPRVAVVYAGVLLVLQRRIYVGHTPIVYGTQQDVANHFSVDGEFLGRIVLGERNATSVQMLDLTPDWYRTYAEPFRLAAKTVPFFFAWRPSDYPYEIGYVWTSKDPQPGNQLPNGFVTFSFDIEGIV